MELLTVSTDDVNAKLREGWKLYGALVIDDQGNKKQKIIRRIPEMYTSLLNIKNRKVQNIGQMQSLFKEMITVLMRIALVFTKSAETITTDQGISTDNPEYGSDSLSKDNSENRTKDVYAEAAVTVRDTLVDVIKSRDQFVKPHEQSRFSYWIQYMTLTFKVMYKLNYLKRKHSNSILQNMDTIKRINGIETEIPENVRLAVEQLFLSIFRSLPGDYYEYEIALRHILYPDTY
jgi:hypothetical protein